MSIRSNKRLRREKREKKKEKQQKEFFKKTCPDDIKEKILTDYLSVKDIGFTEKRIVAKQIQNKYESTTEICVELKDYPTFESWKKLLSKFPNLKTLAFHEQAEMYGDNYLRNWFFHKSLIPYLENLETLILKGQWATETFTRYHHSTHKEYLFVLTDNTGCQGWCPDCAGEGKCGGISKTERIFLSFSGTQTNDGQNFYAGRHFIHEDIPLEEQEPEPEIDTDFEYPEERFTEWDDEFWDLVDQTQIDPGYPVWDSYW